MLRRPRHPRRDTTLNDIACALIIRYRSVHVSDDVDEVIKLLRECLLEHRRTRNLSSALYSCFTQTRMEEDISEATRPC